MATVATDRKGQASSYAVDAFGEVTRATYIDSSVSYGRDVDTGRPTSIADSKAGTVTLTYDGYDRQTSAASPQGTIYYTYDNAGRRATMTVPGQAQTAYSYDAADRLIQITQGSQTVALSYDNAAREATVTLPNGVVGTYSWDAASELQSITYTKGSTTLGVVTYQYDGAGRVNQRGGSLFQSILPTSVTSAVYDVSNRLQQWATPGSSLMLSYDGNGNLLNDGSHVYLWDARNRLSGMPGFAAFTYDGLGRRQAATIKGKAVSYLYDNQNPVQEQSNGADLANILNGVGIDERFTRTEGGTSTTFLTDALGSTMALANAAGAIQTSYGYGPNGQTSVTGVANDNSYQYTGRQNDGTGLYYYRARYYNPTFGRFVSQDPISFKGGLNLYGYARGNPNTFDDPFGLQGSCPDCEAYYRQISMLADALVDSITDLLYDPHDLYTRAYAIPLPGAERIYGTYLGHIEKAEGYQKGLKKLISDAQAVGCDDIPFGAEFVADSDIPMRPSIIAPIIRLFPQ